MNKWETNSRSVIEENREETKSHGQWRRKKKKKTSANEYLSFEYIEFAAPKHFISI